MFNVGGPEILVIFIVALIVLGPQQLPKAMRTFGNVMAEVRKVSNSFQAEMRNAMESAVDTTASEKPQSGSMAAARPTGPTDSDATEVIARNEASAGGDAGAPTAEPADAEAEAAPSARPVDPADRAAG